MNFLGLKFWPKVIFWVYERRRDFFGSRKKTEGFLWVAKKRTKGLFWGMQKKVVIFLGRQIPEVVIFLGIKYEPLSDPPVIKICEWGPWASGSRNYLSDSSDEDGCLTSLP